MNRNNAADSPFLAPLMTLLQTRRSCRRYDGQRPVPRELLDRCAEAARLAPSACNRQPWRFVIADDPRWSRNCGRRPGVGHSHPWWGTGPRLRGTLRRADCWRTGLPRVSGIPLSAGSRIAGEHFVLAAEAQIRRIGWFNGRAARRSAHPAFAPSSPCSRWAGQLGTLTRESAVFTARLTAIRRWNAWGDVAPPGRAAHRGPRAGRLPGDPFHRSSAALVPWPPDHGWPWETGTHPTRARGTERWGI